MSRRRVQVSGPMYVANDSFVMNINGVDEVFRKDATRVREGHVALTKAPHLFDVLVPEHELTDDDER